MDKFLKYLEWVLAHEGGYVNNPRDPGGATNFGVTQGVYNEYLNASGKKSQSVAQITRREVEAIYRVKYWLRIKGDELPAGWDYAMFDFAINSGTSRAIKFAQLSVGVSDDGVLGPKTMAAIKAAPPEAFDKYISMRRDFLVSLKTFPTFGKGWMRRVNEVEEKAKRLLKK
jgi:lysozyme family protein